MAWILLQHIQTVVSHIIPEIKSCGPMTWISEQAISDDLLISDSF